jgi:prepilin signal peptidase PulO-like enzyme (type II secretory pathway)
MRIPKSPSFITPTPPRIWLQLLQPVGDFLKSLGGKIATGAISLAVVSAGLAWWQTEPATRDHILSVSGRLLGWFVLVLILPWASFAAVGWVSRQQSNAAGAALVMVITVAEAAVLAWMFSWSIAGATEWVLYTAAVLVCGVYNLFICDWIAEMAE